MAPTTTTVEGDLISSSSAVADLAEQFSQLYGHDFISVEHPGEKLKAPVLLAPAGLALHSLKKFLDEYRTAPERRQGTATLLDVASFTAHVLRFQDEHSAVFADPNPEKPQLVAVLDYHESGATGAPRFGRHRALYPCPISEEWAAWAKQNGKPMSPLDFAAFLEDRISDVIAPPAGGDDALAQFAAAVGGTWATPSHLIELSRGIQIHVNERVKQAFNLSTGEVSVQYETEQRQVSGQPLKVPSLFALGIPVFRNGAPYRIAVRLRYRLNQGELTWRYDLHRADRVFRHAFEEVGKTVVAETGLPVFLGTPEANQ